ncbi:hypothetical protein BCR34DRAFT_664776 [Clohesyomyces aquaticus]|uniref:Uncharacterized protein n=1 Tax=Clohesyomyces aquaticus TaxID=1231657 RepID=A0A1Y1ZKE6_9PLEO|nr:hypothetical protein BCR34DRAFT_664776 [Clohesyomyces aquaticus]
MAKPLPSTLHTTLSSAIHTTDTSLQSTYLASLVSALSDRATRDAFFDEEFARYGYQNLPRNLDYLEEQSLTGPPSTMQSALRILGMWLDWGWGRWGERRVGEGMERREMVGRLKRFVRILRRNLRDEDPFDSRHAAVLSLVPLTHLWAPTLPPLLTLSLAILIFDLLSDDDEEIRTLTSPIATTLMTSHNYFRNPPSVLPILTAHRLAKFLTRKFTDSSSLCRESLRRLTSASSSQSLFSTPFAELFERERKEDTSLFIREKQNLYRDDTLDAMTFCYILKNQHLSPSSAIPPETVPQLRCWVLDGLAHLVSVAQDEDGGTDGALGWTRKPEVFTLGIRLICLADVVLHWPGEGEEKWRVRRALGELLEVGERVQMHGLLMERIERVLAASVLDVVTVVYRSLPVVGVGEDTSVGEEK